MMKTTLWHQRILVLGLMTLASVLIFSLTLAQTNTPMIAQAAPRELFTSSDASPRASDVLPLPVKALPLPVGAERTRLISFDRETLALLSRDPVSVSLNFFDDVRYTPSSLRRQVRGVGTASQVSFGELADVPYSNIVLLIAPSGDIDLRVLIPGKNYSVQPVSADLYRISEIDTYAQRGYNDAVPIQPDAVQAARVLDRLNSPRADSGQVIDVMVVYTPQAAAFFGGQPFMQIAIENTVALTNKTYENSAVNFRLRLVHTAQVDYVEQPFRDLDRLANPNDGYMDEVHTLRDQYAADLVALIPGNSAAERGYCGVAFLPTTLPAPDAAFSVTEALCLSDITFAHELGHTMGKAHDPANAGGAVHPYAYGYQDPANPTGADWGDFVTVMAYSDGGECPAVFQPGVCPAIAWWSNPDQTFNGKPLGTSGENNALSLNQTAPLIANYRLSADGSPTATPPPTISITPTEVQNLTATPQPLREWVLNGGFEIDADGDRIPDGWSAVNAKQKCDALNCYVVLKGSIDRKAKIEQVLSSINVTSGQLTASAALAGKKLVAESQVIIKVVYDDNLGGSAKKSKVIFALPPGNSPYFELSNSVSILGSVERIKIIAKYGGSSGKMLIDDVRVTTFP